MGYDHYIALDAGFLEFWPENLFLGFRWEKNHFDRDSPNFWTQK